MSRILIIDKNKETEAGVFQALSCEECQADVVHNSLESLQVLITAKYDKQKLDAVFFSINPYDINDLKVLQYIKNVYPHIPVIILASNQKEADEKIRSLGEAALDKPIDIQSFKSLIQNFLDKKDKETPDTGKNHLSFISSPKEPPSALWDYVFIKIEDKDLSLSAYEKLYRDPSVILCDAVRGIYDIILLTKNAGIKDGEEMMKRFSGIEGIGEVVFTPLYSPAGGLSKIIRDRGEFLSDSIENPSAENQPQNFCSAYALIEAEPKLIDDVYEQVLFLDHTLSCDKVKGKYQLIAVMRAPFCRSIEKIINDETSAIKGALRVSQCSIIPLIEN